MTAGVVGMDPAAAIGNRYRQRRRDYLDVGHEYPCMVDELRLWSAARTLETEPNAAHLAAAAPICQQNSAPTAAVRCCRGRR